MLTEFRGKQMTVGLSYNGSISGTTSYVNQIATMAVVDATDPGQSDLI